MKGGVGKTTVTANLFRAVFTELSLKTLLVDLDPQFNLTQAIITEEEYTKLEKSNKTIIAAMESPPPKTLYRSNPGVVNPPAAHEIGLGLRRKTLTPDVRLMLIPGDFRLVKYSLMDEKESDRLNTIRDSFLRFVNKAKDDFDVIAIDCNPSSSFLTVCALHAADYVLAPVRPDRYSVLGIKLMQRLINRLPLKSKPKLHIVINGIDRNDAQNSVETNLRLDNTFGKKVLLSKIYDTNLLRVDNSYAGFAVDKKRPYKNTLVADLATVAKEYAKAIKLL